MVVNVAEVIERHRCGRFQLLLMIVVSSAIIVEGFDIQAIAFVVPVLLKEWGLTRAQLGPAMSAALIGMVLGAPLGGRLGDRFGRRPAMIASTACFGAATLAAGLAGDLTELTIMRFVSGVGFGGLLPNAAALTAEWMPSRVRNHAVAIMIIGVPVGGMIGAAAASWLIADHGWRSTFIAGGVLGLLLAVVLFFALPESLRYLALKTSRSSAIARLLTRAFGAGFHAEDTYVTTAAPARQNWREIFEPQHRRATAGVGLAFSANLLAAYAFFNWVPTMLTAMGMPLEVAIRGAFFYNLFGLAGALCGAMLVARLGSRTGILSMVAAAIVVTALMGYLVQAGRIDETAMMVGLSAAGALISGLQATLYALAACAYPTSCRSSGIGFAVGFGRLGPIASGFGGAFVLSLPGGPAVFFSLIAAVLVLAAIGVITVDRHSPPATGVVAATELKSM